MVAAATSHVFAAAAATSHVFAAAAQVLLSRCLGGGLDAGCGVGYAVLKPRVGCAVLKVPVGYEVLKVHVDTSHASYVSCFIRLMVRCPQFGPSRLRSSAVSECARGARADKQ